MSIIMAGYSGAILLQSAGHIIYLSPGPWFLLYFGMQRFAPSAAPPPSSIIYNMGEWDRMGIAWKTNGLENNVTRFARDINFQKVNYFTPLKFLSKIVLTLKIS